MINTIINLINCGDVNISSQHKDHYCDFSYKIPYQETPNQKYRIKMKTGVTQTDRTHASLISIKFSLAPLDSFISYNVPVSVHRYSC